MYVVGMVSFCVITGYVFFNVMENLYEKKYTSKRYIYICAYVGYVLLSVAINYVKLPVLNTVYSMIILCVLSCMIYDPHGKNVVINSGIVVIYLAIMDSVVTTVFSIFISAVYKFLRIVP